MASAYNPILFPVPTTISPITPIRLPALPLSSSLLRLTQLNSPHLLSGTEAVFAVSHVLSMVGDEATRAEGVTLLPVGGKWSALALKCVGMCSSGLRLTPEEEPSMDEVRELLRTA